MRFRKKTRLLQGNSFLYRTIFFQLSRLTGGILRKVRCLKALKATPLVAIPQPLRLSVLVKLPKYRLKITRFCTVRFALLFQWKWLKRSAYAVVKVYLYFLFKDQ